MEVRAVSGLRIKMKETFYGRVVHEVLGLGLRWYIEEGNVPILAKNEPWATTEKEHSL